MNTRPQSTWLFKALFVGVAIAALALPALAKPLAPGPFGKIAPANGATNVSTSLTLSWSASNTATDYEYCYDATVNDACDGPWTSTSGATSVGLSGLSADTSYDWQVRAVAGGVRAYADAGDWWTFTTTCSTSITVTNNADSGAGSLRQVMADVCAGGTINFDNDYSIVLSSGTLTATKSMTITSEAHNVTVDGGGNVRVMVVNSGKTLNLNELTIQNGKADTAFAWGTSGGAIYNDGTLNVANSTFISNTAPGYAGAILNAGTLTVANSTFSGNSSPDNGGGIDNVGTTLTVINSTFSGNSSGNNNGGAIHNSGTLYLINTILVNSSGFDCANGGTMGLDLRNLIEINPSDAGACGTTNLHNARLGPLANNGGNTQTFVLLPGSEAIDVGDDTNCATAPVSGKDQRGVTRPQHGTCDIGAYEAVLNYVYLPRVLR